MPRTVRSLRLAMVAGVVALPFGLASCSSLGLDAPEFDTTQVAGHVVTMRMPNVAGNRPYMTVDTSIAGGKPVPMLVDTGSPGVRVFESEAGTDSLIPTGNPISVTFADGTTFIGIEASAPVEFGGLTTGSEIKIQLIKEVSCAPQQPECAGSDGIDSFAKTQSFAGIFGIGTQASDVYSPLSQLSSGSPARFSITANPTEGSAELTLNATPPPPVATFPMHPWTQNRLPNGYPAWASNEIDACWAYGRQTARCVPTAFDTGSPTLFTDGTVPGVPKLAGPVTPGTTIGLSTKPDGEPFWTLTAGTTPGRDTIAVTGLEGGNNVNSGISLFTARLVTFDLQRGEVLINDRN